MVNDPVFALGELLFDLMIHEMGRQFAGWSAAFFQSPDNAVIFAFAVKLNNADVVLRLQRHIAHMFAGTGN